jgi:hypothetical protein
MLVQIIDIITIIIFLIVLAVLFFQHIPLYGKAIEIFSANIYGF